MAESTGGVNTNTIIFNGSVFLVSTGVTVFCGYSASYFAKIASATPDDVDADTVGGVKRSAARSMMVVNIILAVLSGLIALWTIYRITFDSSTRASFSSQAMEAARTAKAKAATVAYSDGLFNMPVGNMNQTPPYVVGNPLADN